MSIAIYALWLAPTLILFLANGFGITFNEHNFFNVSLKILTPFYRIFNEYGQAGSLWVVDGVIITSVVLGAVYLTRFRILIISFYIILQLAPFTIEFISIDKCLDSGGKWNYTIGGCERGNSDL